MTENSQNQKQSPNSLEMPNRSGVAKSLHDLIMLIVLALSKPEITRHSPKTKSGIDLRVKALVPLFNDFGLVVEGTPTWLGMAAQISRLNQQLDAENKNLEQCQRDHVNALNSLADKDKLFKAVSTEKEELEAHIVDLDHRIEGLRKLALDYEKQKTEADKSALVFKEERDTAQRQLKGFKELNDELIEEIAKAEKECEKIPALEAALEEANQRAYELVKATGAAPQLPCDVEDCELPADMEFQADKLEESKNLCLPCGQSELRKNAKSSVEIPFVDSVEEVKKIDPDETAVVKLPEDFTNTKSGEEEEEKSSDLSTGLPEPVESEEVEQKDPDS